MKNNRKRQSPKNSEKASAKKKVERGKITGLKNRKDRIFNIVLLTIIIVGFFGLILLKIIVSVLSTEDR
ncbi:hypothetical protein QNI16_36130 [Cytophagaceae bacterium YF14B1]|uniref:Uncharacterized protein n=1 Tax=Xanthocytophaga flava TaxID=3048013 RepID=A0AAE3QZ96_9BACT|nr:hypothetical protein [Xanthocytophaga flavus]MDJ1485966.1 hypothetical protein [Xanthocytophaga flavus]